MPRENEEVEVNEEMDSMLAEVAEGLALAKPDDGASGEGKPEEGKSEGEDRQSQAEAPPAKPSEDTSTGGDDTAGKPAEGTQQTASTKPEAPATWRKEAKAKWDKVDPDIQQEILKRESDVLRGMGEYKTAAEVGRAFDKAVGRYIPLLHQQGLNPYQLIQDHFETHRQLAFGNPQQKADVIRRLVRDYQIPLEGLAASSPESAHVDPVVKDLLSRFDALQSSLTQTTTSQQQATLERLQGEVASFAKDPAHAFFEEVADDIAQLLQTKACKTLQEAYDTAVARNPTVRQKLIANLRQQEDEQRKKESADRAAAARKSTAANVKSSSKARSATAPKGTMDDTLREAADRLFSQ